MFSRSARKMNRGVRPGPPLRWACESRRCHVHRSAGPTDWRVTAVASPSAAARRSGADESARRFRPLLSYPAKK